MRRAALLYHEDQSPGRINFTIAHEFGHYILHRDMIGDDGLYCDENSILFRNGLGIEKEADQFAAALLMPLHDFRAQLPPNNRANFELLGKFANRYGVSLTAAILRWLEYTETRAIMVVSNEGFAHWAWSSTPAYKSGRYIKTKNVAYELPGKATAARREFTDEAKSGIEHASGVWFDEPVIEMCIRSTLYDQEITLLHFGKIDRSFHATVREQDTFEPFTSFRS